MPLYDTTIWQCLKFGADGMCILVARPSGGRTGSPFDNANIL